MAVAKVQTATILLNLSSWKVDSFHSTTSKKHNNVNGRMTVFPRNVHLNVLSDSNCKKLVAHVSECVTV